MRQYIIAAVRTGMQALAALIVAWLINFDIMVDLDALSVVLIAVGVGVVTLVLRWLESKIPWLAMILSLGTTKSGPTYS